MKNRKVIGSKEDKGKLRFDLIPVSAERALAEILTFGAAKYDDRNWEKGLQWSRVYASARRHLASFWCKEDIDAESGFHHLKHALTCIAFLIEYQHTHPELDDRPLG